jgi:uncharacterized membrane protein YozB (DUF420 family)
MVVLGVGLARQPGRLLLAVLQLKQIAAALQDSETTVARLLRRAAQVWLAVGVVGLAL